MSDGAAVDFAVLDAQTFGDAALARDVLVLFVDQFRRLIPQLPALAPDEQAATAHLLKGSCQAIGAARTAALLDRFGTATPDERRALEPALADAAAAVDAAVTARLATS